MSKPTCAAKNPMMKEVQPGTYMYCACGNTKTQPFCDGSHSGTNFSPKPVEVTEAKTIAFCMCRASKNQPSCDGSHGLL